MRTCLKKWNSVSNWRAGNCLINLGDELNQQALVCYALAIKNNSQFVFIHIFQEGTPLGIYSLSYKTSYHKVSWGIEDPGLRTKINLRFWRTPRQHRTFQCELYVMELSNEITNFSGVPFVRCASHNKRLIRIIWFNLHKFVITKYFNSYLPMLQLQT